MFADRSLPRCHFAPVSFPVILTTLLLWYGIAYIPLLYVFGQLFTSMSSLFSFLSYFFLVFSKDGGQIDNGNDKLIFFFFIITGICSSFMSSSEDNMNKYDTYIAFLLLFPDFTLRHALNAMFIVYTKAQIAKQSSHFGKNFYTKFSSFLHSITLIFRTLFESRIFSRNIVLL